MAAGESQITEQHLSDDFLEDARRGATADPSLLPAGALPVASAAMNEAASPASTSSTIPPATPSQSTTPLTLGEAEIDMIRRVLADAGGNISEASKRLGISRNTIYRKLRWGKAD